MTAVAERKSRRENIIKGYPWGWFVVGFSDELKPGDVKTVKYFGEKMALWRGEDGRVYMVDAYCPHLGANLGKGKVVGNDIECPFHAWRFGPDGACKHIPYTDSIPPKAATNTWNVREANGMIHVWYDPTDRNSEPRFELPEMEEVASDEWTPWAHSMVHVKTHSREIVENVVDIAHFSPVHNTEVEEFENEFTDHLAIQRNKATAYPLGGGKDSFFIEATYHGPGFQISRMFGYLETRLVNAHTMVDENSLDLRFGVMMKKSDDPRADEKFQQMYIDNLTKGFQEDLEIWEEKCYREVPLLCKGDGPIMKLRKWYEQFYTP